MLPADWVQVLRSRFAEKLATLRQYAADEVVWDDPPVDHEAAEAQAWAASSKRPRPPTIMPAPKRRLDHTDRGGIPAFLDRHDGGAS